MKRSWPLILSAVLYFGLAVFVAVSLFWWTEYTGKPVTGLLVGLTALISAACAFLGYASLKARFAGTRWTTIFAGAGGILFGNMVAFGGWNGALIFGPPFAIALFGIWASRKQGHHGSPS